MEFQEAADRVTQLSQRPDNQALLKLYALYKQGSEGDNSTKRPGLMDIKGRAKWEAWNKLKGKPQEEARQEYVAFVEELVRSDAGS